MRAILAATVAIGVFASTAVGDHAEPIKAKKAKFDLVNGFFECGSPNTATQSNSTPACAPPLGSLCAFTSSGSGKLSFTTIGNPGQGTQDLKVRAVAKGLTANCNRLHIRLSYRVTTDDCPEGSCTQVDTNELDLVGAFCDVMDGKCKIETTLNTVSPGLFATNGKNAGIQILGCGLKEFFCLGCPADLSCGVLLK